MISRLALLLCACHVAEPRRFIAVGDTGRGNAEQQQVADAMAKKCAADGCDFVVLLGDNIYLSGVTGVDDPQWQTKFETPYTALQMPFYAVLGNHDYGNSGRVLGLDDPSPDFEVQYTTVSPRWRMPGRFYEEHTGAVDMFAMDTTPMMLREAPEQRDALDLFLTRSSAPWRIAFGHHPYYSNGPHGDAGRFDGFVEPATKTGSIFKRFMDENVCGNFDLYLSGHDHALQIFSETCQGTRLLVSGTGAETTLLIGSRPTEVALLELGFMYFVATEDSLRYELVTVSGGTVYEAKMERGQRPRR